MRTRTMEKKNVTIRLSPETQRRIAIIGANSGLSKRGDIISHIVHLHWINNQYDKYDKNPIDKE